MKNNFAYDSVAKALYTDHIENKLSVGDALPLEQELIDYYKVSRTTVRRGIQKLVNNDLVYTVSGSGTFVKGKKQECNKFKLQSFHEYAQDLDVTPKTKVLEFKIEKASQEIAEKLKITEDDLVYHYKRLFYLDTTPIQIEESFWPVVLFPDLSMGVLSHSKYKYIEKTKKMVIKKNRLLLEPMLLDPDTAKLLEMKPNVPVICIKETGFLKNDVVFEYTETIRNSNKSVLCFDIERQKN